MRMRMMLLPTDIILIRFIIRKLNKMANPATGPWLLTLQLLQQEGHHVFVADFGKSKGQRSKALGRFVLDTHGGVQQAFLPVESG